MRAYRRLGMVVGLLAAAFAGAQFQSHLTTEPPEPPFVTIFNDGFTESKVDDCEQGFAPACHWLSLG
ncbi:hypothetical protein ACFVTF_26410 [Kitasatospora sp. NPDC057940]|uniref:hypothetical protein n=1 Tax=Kitasatospora sp. NPDC057940 TaxID=3346285 RepID=UPI0036DB4D92